MKHARSKNTLIKTILLLAFLLSLGACSTSEPYAPAQNNPQRVTQVPRIRLSMDLPEQNLIPGEEVIFSTNMTPEGVEGVEYSWFLNGELLGDRGPELRYVFEDEEWEYYWLDVVAKLGNRKSMVSGFVYVGENPSPQASSGAKNVIFVIGDGMGEAQRRIASYSNHGAAGKLAADLLPYQGLIRTENIQGGITDSAAGGTAFSTGSKTLNGYIAMDEEDNPLPTIAEEARERGLSVGLVTNAPVGHATPATFAAHVSNRNEYEIIVDQMLLQQDFQVLMGGGRKHFLQRQDRRDLLDEARAAGFTVVNSADELEELEEDGVAMPQRLLGVFANDGLPRPYSPGLIDQIRVALPILENNPQGYFLTIEAAQIDWAGHGNDFPEILSDTQELDELVSYLLETIDEDTLLIVSADHETGGLHTWQGETGIAGERGPYGLEDGEYHILWTTRDHTSRPVPISAIGPNAQRVLGLQENTEVYHIMREAYGWD
jgi:alkaline phosphatase